jgi:hypothetical protein
MYDFGYSITLMTLLAVWLYVVAMQSKEFYLAFIQERDHRAAWSWMNGEYGEEVGIQAWLILVVGWGAAFVLAIAWPITWIAVAVVFLLWKLREKQRAKNVN